MRAREVALRILETLFRDERSREEASPGSGRPRSAYTLAAFQREGVARLDAILGRYAGAVLADGVGLGKTYMALALVESTIRSGGDAVIVVPAATRRAWHLALRGLADFDGRWHLLSHAQLARGAEIGPPQQRRLVVVDEAHRFRNPDTLRHRALARLATPPARLLLITATPVNNRIDDLHHLLRLFAPDEAFRGLGVSSLWAAFEDAGAAEFEASAGTEASAECEASSRRERGADALRTIVDAVVVRRTREMLRARFGEDPPGGTGAGPRFPHRATPRPVRYDHPERSRQAAGIAALELAPYDLGRFGGSAADSGSVPALLRLGLVKRLDSSTAALQASLQRLETVLRDTLGAARRGRLPIVRWGRSRSGDGDPLQLSITSLVTRPAPPAVEMDALASSIRRDLGRIMELRRPHDPKLQALIALLKEIHVEKVVVFTEYRDTAESLWNGLSPRFRVARVDGGGAWLGRHPAGRRTVVERFAPGANGLSHPPDRERVDVLVATDVLAEGLNLQDGRHVVSYDLPWNPVRLLQRIGRLDRLGSPHDEIVPYLFLPEDGLDAILGLTRRLRGKLGDIARIVGTGETSALYARLAGGPPERWPDHDHAAPLVGDSEEPRERLRTLWVRHRSPAPPGLADGTRRAADGPALSTATARVHLVNEDQSAAPPPEWVLLARNEPGAGDPGRAVILEVDRQGVVRTAGHGAAAVLQAALEHRPDEPFVARPPPPLPVRAVQVFLRERSMSGAAPAPLSRHDPGRRVAHVLRGRLLREGARVDRRTIARVDALMLRLAAPLDATVSRAFQHGLDKHESLPLGALLDRLDHALAENVADPVTVCAPPSPCTLLAALYVEGIQGSRTGSRGG